MKLNKNTNYYLSEQAQLCVVALFQKALVLMEDVSDILRALKFQVNEGGKLDAVNPEICQLTDEDLEKANLALVELEDA